MITPDKALHHGNTYPFDADDAWWESGDEEPSKAQDWAHYAARGVIANLQMRGGLKNTLHRLNIPEETRKEIIETLAEIIRCAKQTA